MKECVCEGITVERLEMVGDDLPPEKDKKAIVRQFFLAVT
jgi:hypothetical protein